MTQPQNWYANLPSATGAKTEYFYENRFTHRVSDETESFLAVVLDERFGLHLVDDAKGLFDYQSPGMQNHYAGTPFQGKYRVKSFYSVPDDGLSNGGVFTKSDIVHVKMAADEAVINLGNRVFAAIGEQKSSLKMVQLQRGKDGNFVQNVQADGGMQYAVYVTPEIEGRHLFSTPEDLTALGQGLGRLSNAFNALSQDLKNEIKTASQKQISLLTQGAQHILDNQGWYREKFEEKFGKATLDALVDQATQYTTMDQKSWVPSHFNMIHGDVLRTENGIAILDPERVADGFAPEGMDLGQAIVRIALEAPTHLEVHGDGAGYRHVAVPPPQTFEQVSPLIDAYNETAGRTVTYDEAKGWALRSLCVSKLFSVASQIASGNHTAGAGPEEKFGGFLGKLQGAIKALYPEPLAHCPV